MDETSKLCRCYTRNFADSAALSSIRHHVSVFHFQCRVVKRQNSRRRQSITGIQRKIAIENHSQPC